MARSVDLGPSSWSRRASRPSSASFSSSCSRFSGERASCRIMYVACVARSGPSYICSTYSSTLSSEGVSSLPCAERFWSPSRRRAALRSALLCDRP